MKRIYLTLATALSMVLATSAMAQGAMAQGAMEQKLAARFAAADTNHDGKLTLQEAQAGMPRVAAHFDEIDAAHQGFITRDQIEQFAAQHRQ